MSRERKWVLALLLLALALRVGFVLLEPKGFYFEDSLDYDRAARAFLETGHFDGKYYRFPVYPLLMASSYRLFGTSTLPFRIFQALVGTATCLFVFLTARRLFGSGCARLALFGMAVFPVHVVLSGIEYPVLPGTLLIWLVLWLLVERGRSNAAGWGSLIGIASGTALACMLFEGGLALAAFLPLALMLGPRGRREKLRDLSVVALLGTLLVAPWFSWMALSGDFRPLVLKAGIHLPAAPGDPPPLFKGDGENLLAFKLRAMARNPVWTGEHILGEFIHFWDPYPDRLVSTDPAFREQLHARDERMEQRNPLVGDLPRSLYAGGFALLLAGAAVGAMGAFREAKGHGILVGWPVVLGLCYAPFFTQMRYRIPADPAFIILGAYAVEAAIEHTLWSRIVLFFKALWEGWKKIGEKMMVVWTFVLLMALFLVVIGPVSLLMRLFGKNPMEAKMAPGSFWALRERTREGLEECSRQF